MVEYETPCEKEQLFLLQERPVLAGPPTIAAYALTDALALLNPKRLVGEELLASVQLDPVKPPLLPPPLNWIPVPDVSNARRQPLPDPPGVVVISMATTERAVSVGVGIA
jgi:hypothetical protein